MAIMRSQVAGQTRISCRFCVLVHLIEVRFRCPCDPFILKLDRQSSAWAVLVMGQCYVVILRAREAPQSRGSRRFCVLSPLMTVL